MNPMIRRLCLVLSFAALVLLVPFSGAARAQKEEALSDAEVEQLREAAYTPDERVLVFIKILDSRADHIRELAGKPRRPGREEDLHDLFEQFNSIIDEFNDNLDDYGPRHYDLRKQLPKLLQATDRWATAIRSPADNDAYNVARSLSLEAIQDTREETTKLVEEQRTWFAAHPPSKEKPGAVHSEVP